MLNFGHYCSFDSSKIKLKEKKNKPLYEFISMNICPGKNLQVIIFIVNLKRKNFCLNNFSCSFLVQKLFAKILQFLSKFSYFFQTFNFYSKTIDKREKFFKQKMF